MAVTDTNREVECEDQSYLQNTEETPFSYDAGLSSQELEDAIRRRSTLQMRTFPWISSVRKDCGDGIRTWT